MKKLAALVVALVATPLYAQTPTPPPSAPNGLRTAGSVIFGTQAVDNSTDSSKLTEYRDLRDDSYLPRLTFSLVDPSTGGYFDLVGGNVSRDDQTILAKAGRTGIWSVEASWIGIPHQYSNKAVTPYIRSAPGVFTVPATVPITFKKLATSAADAPGVVASDGLIAAYQSTFLAPTPLGTQTNVGRLAFNLNAADALALGVAWDRREKDGSKSGFGPIGDRPPRTLNVQLAEPVEYRTSDLTFSAEHQGHGYQVRAEYLYSDFANAVDTLKWQNMYTTAAPGADFDVWDRLVSTYGQRPLPPDNQYHNITVNAGVDMPRDSRLTGTVSYGRFEQNAALLPYAYGDSALLNRTLPRSTADAQMNTMHVAADYVMNPARGLTVKAFFRQYTLTNDTPSSRWQYVTQDTYNVAGTVSYLNKRVSLPTAWDRQNIGAEAIWRPARRNTLTLTFEREGVDRDHREANTDENVFRAAWRMKPARWASVKARYTFADRKGTAYHDTVTRGGYWYSLAEVDNQNNPGNNFDNHPDMRRYDVSDRRRQQVDVTVNLTPRDRFAVSAYVRYRSDDFDSGVVPTQPLAGTGLADQNLFTPGNQLGWLEDARLRYGTDIFVQPSPRVTLNAFLNYDKGTSFEKSLEYNENNRQNPSTVNTVELGPWTRAGSQWTADFTDKTWSGGFGASWQLAENGTALVADYTLSLATIDITYGGFGVTNWDGTPYPPNHQFAFPATPPAIREDLQAINVRLEVPVKTMTLIVGYGYETYTLEDWQQGSTAPWVEPVGADTLLRDTSRSHQWGNRLFNLGTYLAPSFNAHIGFVGVKYRF